MNAFKESDENRGGFFLRLVVVAMFVLIGLSVLAWRLHKLQVKEYEKYRTESENNYIAPLPLVPQRGNIIDRNGKILARNFIAFTLEITYKEVDNLSKTIDELGSLIAIEPKDRDRFNKFRRDNPQLKAAPIRTRLSDEEVARFMANRYRFPGVDVQTRFFRDYPNGPLASHLIGYINRISEADVKKIEERNEKKNYEGTDHIGQRGVEERYEADLHGITGTEYIERNNRNVKVRTRSIEPETPGNTIQLSVDLDLQRVAEAAFGERRGALVAIDPTNGEVLALVSMPTFDPNLFVDGISSENWKMLNTSIDKPLLNRAIYSAYPPGSTFKPFMALAGLTNGKRTITQKISDPGYFNYGGHTFKDDKKGGHGLVDLPTSIIVSCNTYYYLLANDLGIDGISGFIGQFGLGSFTGIDIPGEAQGVLPSQEWKKKRFARLGKQAQKWYGGETISVGIGQGYNAYTPVQMATAMAALANEGKLIRPHVARAIITQQGQEQLLPTEITREIDVKPEYMAAVRNALASVTVRGTATRSFIGAQYQAAGKTGTAQVYSLKGGAYDKSNERMRDHSWFIAYAPTNKPDKPNDPKITPRIALSVLVENGGFGAVSAAPIARQVIDAYLLGKQNEKAAPEDTDISPEDENDGDDSVTAPNGTAITETPSARPRPTGTQTAPQPPATARPIGTQSTPQPSAEARPTGSTQTAPQPSEAQTARTPQPSRPASPTTGTRPPARPARTPPAALPPETPPPADAAPPPSVQPRKPPPRKPQPASPPANRDRGARPAWIQPSEAMQSGTGGD
ncbi:MAG: penicillin-binding protein 2 [Azoarcus sp.]|jgi:penicillin-binding protein 2|nr:penicillin-binding protein 2 [Azoarcus sp.]